MKKITKFNALILLGICPFLFTSCGNGREDKKDDDLIVVPDEDDNKDEENKDNENKDEEGDDTKDLPSLYEVMSNVSKLRNYTFHQEDDVLDVVTDLYYTENAYYYEADDEKYGGSNKGYAVSNDGEVFTFTLSESGEVVANEVYRDKNGNIITNLWGDAIISFADFKVEAFKNEEGVNNVYTINDSSNKLLFALLAGYGDTFVMDYITVSVEVLSETEFKSTVHFASTNENYVGDCVGTLKNIGTTSISSVETYLKNGGGPKTIGDEEIIALLQSLKEKNNFLINVSSSSTSNVYNEIYNENYYYQELSNDSSVTNLGIINVNNELYNFTVKNNEVILSNKLTVTNSSKPTSIAENSKYDGFSSINLSNLSFTTGEDGDLILKGTNISALSPILELTHYSAYFSTVNEKDYATFSDVEEDSLTIYYHHYENSTESVYLLKISDINSAKMDLFDTFIESNSNFDSSDLSLLKESLNSFKNSKKYTIEVVDGVSAFVSGSFNKGNKKITFADNNYYLENESYESNSIGYKVNESGEVYSYKLVDGVETKIETISDKTSIWDGCFVSFIDFDFSDTSATRSFDGSYSTEDTTFITNMLNIMGYDASKLTTYFTKAVITLSSSGFTFISDASSYGSISATFTLNA